MASSRNKISTKPGNCDAHDCMQVSKELGAAGFVVRDNYLQPVQVGALLDCVRERQTRGEFTAARVGAAATLQHAPAVRGDQTCWLNEPLLPAEQSLLLELEQLRMQLNRDLFLGLFELESHYAWYPPGAGYVRHVDQPQGRGDRRVSLILYLNENWDEHAGGELQIFDENGAERRIAPFAGRLVCFLSEGREHAVLPAHRDRFSVAGWFSSRTAESG
jgi:SM-20-related protein